MSACQNLWKSFYCSNYNWTFIVNKNSETDTAHVPLCPYYRLCIISLAVNPAILWIVRLLRGVSSGLQLVQGDLVLCHSNPGRTQMPVQIQAGIKYLHGIWIYVCFWACTWCSVTLHPKYHQKYQCLWNSQAMIWESHNYSLVQKSSLHYTVSNSWRFWHGVSIY